MKWEYRDERNGASVVCILAAMVVLGLTIYTTFFMNEMSVETLAAAVPKAVVVIVLIATGIYLNKDCKRIREKHVALRKNGKRYDGKVDRIIITESSDSEKARHYYKFIVSYLNEKNEIVTFETPYVRFKPEPTDQIFCDVYDDGTDRIADSFRGYTQKGVWYQISSFLLFLLIAAVMIVIGLLLGGCGKAVENTDNPNPVQYHALLIGEEGYPQILHGPRDDVSAMQKRFTSIGYRVIDELDASKEDIFNLIDVLKLDVVDSDVVVFYYSGHGVTEDAVHEPGSIVTALEEYITPGELLDALGKVPGKVVLLLDSCGSGAFADAIAEYEKDSLHPDKFVLIAAGDTGEKSLTKYKDGSWQSIFTKTILEGLAEENGCFPADADKDGAVTITELYEYSREYAEEPQNIVMTTGDDMLRIANMQDQ